MASEGLIQQRVVVGVDGSAEPVAALGWAARYAQQAGATVRAVLAWHYPGPASGRFPACAGRLPFHCLLRRLHCN